MLDKNPTCRGFYLERWVGKKHVHRDAAVQWEGWHGGVSTPAVRSPGESWADQLGGEGQRGSSLNKGMEEGEPMQFVNGWPSGETRVSVVGRRGRLGQALGWVEAFVKVCSQQGHDTVRALALVVRRPGCTDSQRQANPRGQEGEAV